MHKARTRLYNRKEAEQIGNEIAKERIESLAGRVDELANALSLTLKRNKEIDRSLEAKKKQIRLLSDALIYYDTTFERLPEKAKAQFIKIGKGVIKDYDLPF